jgi:hypothetical protein
MRGTIRGVLAGALVAYAVFGASAGPAWAKTPGYILTGGELGDRALHFYTDHYIEMAGPHAVEVAEPDSWPGVPYLLYSNWPFEASRQLGQKRPLAYLFPATRVVLNPESGTWLQLDDTIWEGQESWSGIQKALDVARLNPDALATGPIMGALIGRDFDDAWWDVFSGRLSDLARFSLDMPATVFSRGLDPRTGPDGQPARRLDAGDFPLEEFARSLSLPPLAEPAPSGDTYVYRFNISAPNSSGSWHAPGLMYYAPPLAGRGGRLWEGAGPGGRGGALPPGWASTPEFDASFAAALRAAEARAAVPSPTLPGLPQTATEEAADRDDSKAFIVAGILAATAAITAAPRLRSWARAHRA